MSSSITVRDIDPADKSWLKREARQVGVSMEEFVRRLTHEKRTKAERRPKPAEAIARHFGMKRGANCRHRCVAAIGRCRSPLRTRKDSAVPHNMPDALPHRRRKPTIVEPLQNRLQKQPIRSLRNRHRYRLQRRKRPRNRPLNLQAHTLRRAAPTTPPTRATQRRKLNQTGPRELPKQRTRRNLLQPTAATGQFQRSQSATESCERPHSGCADNSARISDNSASPMRRPRTIRSMPASLIQPDK